MNWRTAVPELIVAAAAVITAALAAAAIAGWPGVATVATAAAVAAVGLLRAVVPRPAAPPLRRAHARQQGRLVSGYAQRRSDVSSGLASGPLYESELRPVLEHVLAARLAERHEVNLYTEAAAARAVFCRNRGDDRLWPWIDPTREPDPVARGIPRRTLARLVTRLEQL